MTVDRVELARKYRKGFRLKWHVWLRNDLRKLLCRIFRHRWTRWLPWRGPGAGEYVRFCRRCGVLELATIEAVERHRRKEPAP